jgi:outer membrane protein
MSNTTKTLCWVACVALLAFTGACKRVNSTENNTPNDSTAIVVNADTALTSAIADPVVPDTTPTQTNAVMPPNGVKYGYLNSLELLAIMPETRTADKKLADLQRSKEASFSALAQKYQDGMRTLQEKGQDMTRIEQEAKMKEMAELEEKIQKMQMSGGEDLAAEKEKLYAPILAKADKYIKQVGKEQGYQYIFDATALLYADTTKDILPLVKRKMGLK